LAHKNSKIWSSRFFPEMLAKLSSKEPEKEKQNLHLALLKSEAESWDSSMVLGIILSSRTSIAFPN